MADQSAVSSSAVSNKSNQEQQRARLRNNQRNSRARKQAYLEELEKKWAQCVRTGAEATVEMQTAARKVQTDNEVLKTMLLELGVLKEQIDARLKAAGSEGFSENLSSRILSPKPCCLPSGYSSQPSTPNQISTPVEGQPRLQALAQVAKIEAVPQPIPTTSSRGLDVTTNQLDSQIPPHSTPLYQQETSAFLNQPLPTYPTPFDETWLTDLHDGNGDLNQDFSDAFDTFINPVSPSAYVNSPSFAADQQHPL